MTSATGLVDRAERERVSGNPRKALKLYEEALSEDGLKSDLPRYIDALLMAEVCARRLNEFEKADRYDSELDGLVDLRPDKAWVYYRNKAERLRKEAMFKPIGRSAQLRRAREVLGKSAELIQQSGARPAERAATRHFLGRLLVSQGRLDDAEAAFMGAMEDLSADMNPHYFLYLSLDHVEVQSYRGKRDWPLFKMALVSFPTALVYGNRWPVPQHFLRAAFNFFSLLLPGPLARLLLRRRGRLISRATYL